MVVDVPCNETHPQQFKGYPTEKVAFFKLASISKIFIDSKGIPMKSVSYELSELQANSILSILVFFITVVNCQKIQKNGTITP